VNEASAISHQPSAISHQGNGGAYMSGEGDAPDDPTYDELLTLDRLESLREEMLDLGATTADELAARPDRAAAEALAELRDLGLASLAALTARIDALHRDLDETG
jgi:hypothetical protein